MNGENFSYERLYDRLIETGFKIESRESFRADIDLCADNYQLEYDSKDAFEEEDFEDYCFEYWT